jgi:hypothetical protein
MIVTNTARPACAQADPETAPDVGAHQCECHHDPRWLKAEIDAKRYPQEYRVGENGEYVLVCVKCGGLWDHRATDRLIELIMRGEWAGARP